MALTALPQGLNGLLPGAAGKLCSRCTVAEKRTGSVGVLTCTGRLATLNELLRLCCFKWAPSSHYLAHSQQGKKTCLAAPILQIKTSDPLTLTLTGCSSDTVTRTMLQLENSETVLCVCSVWRRRPFTTHKEKQNKKPLHRPLPLCKMSVISFTHLRTIMNFKTNNFLQAAKSGVLFQRFVATVV